MPPPPDSPETHPAPVPRGFAGQRLWLAGALLLYVAVFAGFALPYLRQMHQAVPTYPFAPDAKLIIWILAWVAHALADPALSVFDGNIYHPAPAQLTGSEYLFTLQLLFAPLYRWTQQPVLSAGVVAFATYPLAAFLMAALLVRVGCTRLVAWLIGLVYAVGLLRVPLNLHVLQYPNLFLPLVAIGVVQARDAPDLRRGLWLFVFLLATFLTSYYIAVITCIAMGLWMLAELFGARSRLRFVITVGLAAAAAAVAAGFVLQPYFARSAVMAAAAAPFEDSGEWAVPLDVATRYFRRQSFPWVAPFAALALLGIGWRGAGNWRRLALPGAMLFALGSLLTVVGLPGWLGELASHTPLRSFRGWLRLLLLSDFGLYLLAAAGLDACRRRFGMLAAAVPLAAFAALAAPHLARFGQPETFTPRPWTDRKGAYSSVKHYAVLGRGPLLELPSGLLNDSEALLGSTLHWLPLVNGFTGYPPAHASAMRNATAGLPRVGALRELVDLTRVHWILLRPAEDWPTLSGIERMREGLVATGLIGRTFKFLGFTLLEVKATPLHEGWYAAIAAGQRPGASVLGTPARELVDEEAIAAIVQLGPILASAQPNTFQLRLQLANEGTADWPALLSQPADQLSFGRAPMPHEVYLEARWSLLRGYSETETPRPLVQRHQLIRDIPAGEILVQTLLIQPPTQVGGYRFDVRVAQEGGSGFREPPSHMFHHAFDIESYEEEGAGAASAEAAGDDQLDYERMLEAEQQNNGVDNWVSPEQGEN